MHCNMVGQKSISKQKLALVDTASSKLQIWKQNGTTATAFTIIEALQEHLAK